MFLMIRRALLAMACVALPSASFAQSAPASQTSPAAKTAPAPKAATASKTAPAPKQGVQSRTPASSAAALPPNRRDEPAPKLHDAERRGVRSINADVPTSIRFINRSGGLVRVYWLDYKGQRRLYQTLNHGAEYLQQTYVTHPWLIVDAKGYPRRLFLPDGQPRTVTISAPR